jgi:hypothetical protein
MYLANSEDPVPMSIRKGHFFDHVDGSRLLRVVPTGMKPDAELTNGVRVYSVLTAANPPTPAKATVAVLDDPT